MAKRSFSVATYTPTATADTTALANNTFQAIGATNAATGLLVTEIYIGGQATSSNVMFMQFARDSTLGVTPTALAAPATDGPLNTLTVAAQVVSLTYNFAGTSPQRSVATTAARLDLSMNAFGGIVRWVAYPGEEWGIVGVSVNISESSLSNYTGGASALISSHVVYEGF